MIIEQVAPSRKSFSDFSLEEEMLTIGGILIDLEDEQEDQEKIIAITRCSITGDVVRGMLPCCDYLAEVVIPPRKYELLEVENERGEDDDENEEPGTRTESVPVPLDLNSVTLKLWPYEAEEKTEQEGVMYAE